MKNTWQVQDAKNRFSALVDQALRHGPQIITRRGTEAVVVLSVKDYARLTEQKESLVNFFRESPLRGVDLDLNRSKDPCRGAGF